MFDLKCKPDKSGTLEVTMKLHAATKRKIEFVLSFVDTLAAAHPSEADNCENVAHGLRNILKACEGVTTLPKTPEVDEATEAKLDEIAPRPSKAG